MKAVFDFANKSTEQRLELKYHSEYTSQEYTFRTSIQINYSFLFFNLFYIFSKHFHTFKSLMNFETQQKEIGMRRKKKILTSSTVCFEFDIQVTWGLCLISSFQKYPPQNGSSKCKVVSLCKDTK